MPLGRDHAFSDGHAIRRPMPRFLMRSLGILSAAWGYSGAFLASWGVWASFERNAIVGERVALGPNAWCVNKGARTDISLGSRVICRGLLRRESFGDGKLVIHNDVYIGDDCLISCAARIEIHPFVMLAHGVQVFDNDSHPLDWAQREDDYRALQEGSANRSGIAAEPVEIGPHAWVGFGSIVVKGVKISEGSIVAAGSVVTEDVPPHCVVAGNPARIVRRLVP